MMKVAVNGAKAIGWEIPRGGRAKFVATPVAIVKARLSPTE